MGSFEPAGNVIGGGFKQILSYLWIFIPIVVIGGLLASVWWYKKIKEKETQWTHKLKVRRVLVGGRLSDTIVQRMRRFPLIKKAEVFELENALLGGYLLPELDEYSGENEFSIVLDTNNRIYTNKGEFFIPDKSCVNVSAKHSEIDIQRQNLKGDFQNINKVSKRIEWATIAKYALMIMATVCFTILGIIGISNWSDAQAHKSQQAQAEAQAMLNLAEALDTMEAVVNTQKLEILPIMEKIYGTKNIQSVINNEVKTNED